MKDDNLKDYLSSWDCILLQFPQGTRPSDIDLGFYFWRQIKKSAQLKLTSISDLTARNAETTSSKSGANSGRDEGEYAQGYRNDE